MTTLFDNTAPTPVEIDPNKDYLVELVGEGKKFADPHALARGKAESDAFVLRLQNEARALREELAAKQRLEDLVDQLGSRTTPPAPVEPPPVQPQEPAITPDKIASMLDERLREREQARIQTENLALVKSKLIEAFGDNYTPTLAAKARELGVSPDFLDGVAKTQPQVFLKLVEADRPAPQPNPSAPYSAVNSTVNRQPTDRTERFYDNLKKTNSTEYWKPATQNAMHRDALRLGPAFFDKN